MSLQKFPYTRSPKLMKAYRTIPCQNCGRDDGTVCGAHSNQAKHGKGKSVKASDQFAASLCSQCHTMIDQFIGISRAQAEQLWERAHRKTVMLLNKLGRWPVEVPVPDEFNEEPARVSW